MPFQAKAQYFIGQHHHVADHAALGSEMCGIAALAGRQLLNIIGHHTLQPRATVRAR